MIEEIRTLIDDLIARGSLEAPPTFFEVTTAIAFELFRRAGVDDCGARSGSRRPARLDQHRRADCRGDHVDRFRSRAVSRPYARRHRGRERRASSGAAFRSSSGPSRRKHATCSSAMCDPPAPSSSRRTPAAGSTRQIENGRTIVHLGHPGARLRVGAAGPARRSSDAERGGRGPSARGAGTVYPSAGRIDHRRPPRRPVAGTTADGRAAGGRRVLLDAAHNPAGAWALASYLKREFPEPLPMVFGAMRDKDVALMLKTSAAGLPQSWS